MDLSAKFKMITACQQIRVTSLLEDAAYPIERAERASTKYGETILLTLRDVSSQTYVKVFLPRRYGALFSDDNLQAINEKTVALSLTYKGTNPANNAYVLEVE